ncbi:MAG: ABC transporter ATP-binding protein [Paracoccaceae bacterium]|nr:ABC transporter ATP-binding protein [Paracoccaceae bacterium]
MARLSLQGIRKSFARTEILKGITLDVEDGEFISLVGASGCGKSTLLRIIAGLEHPDEGSVSIDGKPVDEASPKARNVAMVFQDYALYPHMTVAQNMAMPLIMGRLPMRARLPGMRLLTPGFAPLRREIATQVETVARQLRIDHLLERKPAQLSGGQRQRVALGRALVRNPHLFLMDEPLSNLDAKLRVQVRQEIVELHQNTGLTFVYVTHDQVEAMTMSNRVALLQEGRLLQVGTPDDLYSDPDSLSVARFIGSPEINVLPAQARAGGFEVGDQFIPVPHQLELGSDLFLAVRPEGVMVAGAGARDGRQMVTLAVTRTGMEDLGGEIILHTAVKGLPGIDLRARLQKEAGGVDLDLRNLPLDLNLSFSPRSCRLFAASGARIRAGAERAASLPTSLESVG